MNFDPTLGNVLGFIGAVLMVASYLMKSMLPLRLAALVASFFFFAYGAVKGAWPTLFLYTILIPINIKKSLAVWKLVKSIERARADTPLADWLLPHMTRRTIPAGTMLWHKGDRANEMVYIESGMIRLVEHAELRGPGTLIGEIGMLSPDNRRTLTISCETDCVVYALSAEDMVALYYQNPKLGFHVMRLVVQRLLHDADKARVTAAAADRGDPRVGAPAA
jgi:CRP/FNR family transcriptional regulator, cyclic AMP receptor protein